MNWPTAFALTLLIELPLVALLAPTTHRRRALGDGLGANLLTHPLAYGLFGAGLVAWTPLELGVAAIELLVYRLVTGLPWWRAALVSLVANGVSATMSFVV